MKGIATDSCQWYNGYQQKSDNKPCFDTEFTKSLITLFFIHFSPRLFIHYTKKSQDNPSKTQIEKDCTYLSQENLYHIIFYKKKFHKQGCFVNLLQKNFAVYCHHKANVKKPERRRKQTYEEKICSFCYDPCDERS